MSEEAGPSRASGACVLVALAAVCVGIVFAVSTTVGILGVWFVGAVLLYRSARRMPDMPATPPGPDPAPSGDVYAGETGEVDRVERGPEGVTCIIHPKRVEVVGPDELTQEDS